MLEELQDVPPTLPLLMNELPSCTSLKQMRRRVREMLPELRDQSENFQVHQIRRRIDPKERLVFDVHLHGAMDLLSGRGCSSLDCRLTVADRLARSVGLIADRVWLTDLLTEKFVDFGRSTNARIDEVLADVLVLSRILPLIKAGIVKFRSPWAATCDHCLRSFEGRIDDATKELVNIFRKEFRVDKGEDGFVAHTGRCIEPHLTFQLPKRVSNRAPSAISFAKRWVSGELRSAAWVAREASMTGGAVFSNSRIALAGLLQQDGQPVDLGTLLLMDRERELNIPWVTELSASQVVDLREEASSALPALREMLCRYLSAHDMEKPASVDFVAELRQQATDVRSELESKRKHSARYWKATYTILGLALSAYGVAADEVAAGVGGLLPMIRLLIEHKSDHEHAVSRIVSRPGFVLVKAQDILAHSEAER